MTESENPKDDKKSDHSVLRKINQPDFILDEDDMLITLHVLKESYGQEVYESSLLTLLENFRGYPYIVQVLAEGLSILTSEKEVEELQENKLKQHLINKFPMSVLFDYQPEKKDSKDSDDSKSRPALDQLFIAWAKSIINYESWRKMVYELWRLYPNKDNWFLKECIKAMDMDNLPIQFVEELCCVPEACTSKPAFTQCLRHLLLKLYIGSYNEGETQEQVWKKFVDLASYSEWGYLYTQALLNNVTERAPHKRLSRLFSELLENAAIERGRDVTKYSVYMKGARNHPRAIQAVQSMLSRRQLNTADISVLYNLYNEDLAPTVSLLQIKLFIDLLTDALFIPGNCKPSDDNHRKYCYLLAYATSAREVKTGDSVDSVDRSHVPVYETYFERASSVCQQQETGHMCRDLSILLDCVQYRPVAYGLLKYVGHVVSDSNYFKLNTEQVPPHLFILDECAQQHEPLREPALDIIKKVFVDSIEGLDQLVALELRKVLVDVMIKLMMYQCYKPVLRFMSRCLEERLVDLSVVRYFIVEAELHKKMYGGIVVLFEQLDDLISWKVLGSNIDRYRMPSGMVIDILKSPYPDDFVQLFLPIVSNEGACSGLRKGSDEEEKVQKFLNQYRRSQQYHSK